MNRKNFYILRCKNTVYLKHPSQLVLPHLVQQLCTQYSGVYRALSLYKSISKVLLLGFFNQSLDENTRISSVTSPLDEFGCDSKRFLKSSSLLESIYFTSSEVKIRQGTLSRPPCPCYIFRKRF